MNSISPPPAKIRQQVAKKAQAKNNAWKKLCYEKYRKANCACQPDIAPTFNMGGQTSSYCQGG
jgi:hypothetical protein